MLIGVSKLEFFFPEVHSLKEKRGLLRTILEKTSHRFRVPLSEVGHQDLWQRGLVGFAIVGSDRQGIAALMDKMVGFIESLGMGEVTSRSADIIDFE